MTFPSKIDLINRERTWKEVICLNPGHQTVKFDTNDTGTIKCPICKSPMVVFVKSVITIQNESNR